MYWYKNKGLVASGVAANDKPGRHALLAILPADCCR